MEAIGGYFSLELPNHSEFHQGALRLNTGRNCLEYILRVRKYRKVYIPYYTCEVILEPFRKLGVDYGFYHINIKLEIAQDIKLKKGEALLYTNYFGLKQHYIEKLVDKYESQLILDNTQAFYADRMLDVDSFYTCRKFFGVPDGAYLYCDAVLNEEIGQDNSYERMAHLLKRIDLSAEDGYADFRKVDDGLDKQPIRKMSKLTQRMMQSVDYHDIALKRRANYEILHNVFGKNNSIELPLGEGTVPMVYPYLVSKKGLREKLIENKIFVARYWPNVLEWTTKEDIEYLLAFQLLPLPIDQRYNKHDMDYIIRVIKSYNE